MKTLIVIVTALMLCQNLMAQEIVFDASAKRTPILPNAGHDGDGGFLAYSNNMVIESQNYLAERLKKIPVSFFKLLVRPVDKNVLIEIIENNVIESPSKEVAPRVNPRGILDTVWMNYGTSKKGVKYIEVLKPMYLHIADHTLEKKVFLQEQMILEALHHFNFNQDEAMAAAATIYRSWVRCQNNPPKGISSTCIAAWMQDGTVSSIGGDYYDPVSEHLLDKLRNWLNDGTTSNFLLNFSINGKNTYFFQANLNNPNRILSFYNSRTGNRIPFNFSGEKFDHNSTYPSYEFQEHSEDNAYVSVVTLSVSKSRFYPHRAELYTGTIVSGRYKNPIWPNDLFFVENDKWPIISMNFGPFTIFIDQ
jgi:hypothetical protein